ncbi:MAG: acyltransferase, partial [Gammaproteobacteria bacterium]|nr:acyltransferase [Gammaproteobacteria bacterium]
MSGEVLRAPSRVWLRGAELYLKRFARRHFNRIRIAVDAPAPQLGGPTIFYTNHPSWWDPIAIFLLIREHYPEWRFHGPIDAEALARYPWLERIGLFGIEPGRASGARRLLAAADSLLTEQGCG